MAFGSTKRIACSLAFAAMLSSPAMAADHDVKDSGGLILSTLGEFAVGYRNSRSNEDADHDGVTISGSGRVSIPFGMNFSVQLDAEGESYFADGDEDAQGVWLLGGHASLRDPNLGLLGIFGAIGQGLNENPESVKMGFLVGGEVQAYLGDFTLYGQGGYADFEVDDNPEGFVEGWFVRGVGRWFITPDMMVEAELSYGETDSYIDGDDDRDNGEFWNWGVKGKMRIPSSLPIYGVLSYRGGGYDATTETDDGSEHVFLVGVSILFGPATLKKNDRLGATLDMPLLPGRAAAWTEGLD